MPLCWIFLLKRRRALSNVAFSPTRTSANRCSPPPTWISISFTSGARPAGWTCARRGAAETPESSRGSRVGQSLRDGLHERPARVLRRLQKRVELLDHPRQGVESCLPGTFSLLSENSDDVRPL